MPREKRSLKGLASVVYKQTDKARPGPDERERTDAGNDSMYRRNSIPKQEGAFLLVLSSLVGVGRSHISLLCRALGPAACRRCVAAPLRPN